MSFHLWYLGAEVPTLRILLQEQGVEHVGVNFRNLRSRLPKTKPYLLRERFTDGQKVLLESGGTQSDKLSTEEAFLYAETYQTFVENNIDDVTLVTEFDSSALGPDWVRRRRGQFYDELPRAKFCPVWHVGYGLPELERLAAEYDHVGIPERDLTEATTLAVRVNGLIMRYGTDFHALACAKPDELRSVRFSTASTSSWLSPMKYGETIVWDGARLVRYPTKYKSQARARHKMAFERAGFDPDLIAADDSKEVARFTLWSYRALEANVERRRPPVTNPFLVIDGGDDEDDVEVPQLADNSDDSHGEPFAELAARDADNSVPEVRNSQRRLPTPRSPEERMNLPVLGFDTVPTTEVAADGSTILGEQTLVRSSPGTMRQCDSCYVASNCPAYKPASACGFNLPVSVQSKEQLKALLTAMIEMQGQRIAFARFAEELNGGYPDPNLSSELDRLSKLVLQLRQIEDNSSFLRVSVEQRGTSGGVLSQIFGDRAQALAELPQGLGADATNRIIDQGLNG